MTNKMSFEALDEMVRRAPFHRWLAVELVALNDDDVVLRMPRREEMVSSVTHGYIHGGVLASLVDLTAVFAIAAKLGRGAPTIDLRVDFHRPAITTELRAIGRVIRLGRTIATAEATILDAEGVLVASGRGAFLPPA